MFERYTERARRVIFFARYEASRFGSTTIEPEHMLLGLIREDGTTVIRFANKNLDDLIASSDNLRREVEKRLVALQKISQSIDLPLSDECKRILRTAGEAAETLGHRHIRTDHLLLGILSEVNTPAAEVLRSAGITIEAVRDSLQQPGGEHEVEGRMGQFPYDHLPPASRESVQELLDKVPDSSLSWVKLMLERLTTAPSSPAAIFPFGPFGRPLHFSSAAGVIRDAEGKITDGRITSTRHEGSVTIVRTEEFYRGHRISTTERISMNDDGKKLSFSHEIVGPKVEQQHKCSIEFDVA